MAYTFVNSGGAENTNVTTYSPTAGNLIVLMSSTSSGAGNPNITSWQTNGAANLAIPIASISNSGLWYTVGYLENCPAGVTSITATYNGGTPGTVTQVLVEYSGIATSGSLIATTPAANLQTAPGTGANAIVSGTQNVILPGAGALILGLHTNSEGHSMTAGTGYTSRIVVNANFAGIIQDLRATSNGNQTATTQVGLGGTLQFTSAILAFSEPLGIAQILMGQACL